MYYNLDLFGKEVCRIRNNLKLTQNDISKSTGINTDTLRKIENGKVMPRQETLDLISMVLKKDLNSILLKYRLDDYNKFNTLKNRIENKIESGNFSGLEMELIELYNFLSSSMNDYFSKLGKQLYLLVESIVLKINYNDYNTALDKLIKSMQITISSFNILKYESFIYSTMEIRILMNIALILNKSESKEICFEILLFCLECLEPEENEFKIKIYFNLSYTCHRMNLNEQALHYSSIGIETCVNNNSLSCLGLLYYRKGIAEYHLEKDIYINSLLKSISIFEISKQHDLKEMVINSCEKLYNIKIQ